MFDIAQLAESGILISLDADTEGAIHSWIVDNTTGQEKTVIFEVAGITLPVTVSAAPQTAKSVVINIPAGSNVSVVLQPGLTVTASYVRLPIDATAALNRVQQILATIPEAQLDDTTVDSLKVWSSKQVSDRLATKADTSDLNQAMADMNQLLNQELTAVNESITAVETTVSSSSGGTSTASLMARGIL